MQPSSTPAGSLDPALSVVVPAYQAGARLRAFVPVLLATLDDAGIAAEVLIVDDGSTDGSTDGPWPERCRVLRHDTNRGKGAAVRTGAAAARAPFVGVIDADGQYDPGGLIDLHRLCVDGWDIALGQRFDTAGTTVYSPLRRLGSKTMAALVRTIVDPGLGETQAGIKVFRAEVLARVVPHLRVAGFAGDVEVLAWARALGHRRHAVHPVRFVHDGRSTVTIGRSARTISDLVGVRRRVRSAPTDRPRCRGAARRERRALEVWSHASRLAVVAPTARASVDELLERAGRDAELLDSVADMIRTQDRRVPPSRAATLTLVARAASIARARETTGAAVDRPAYRFAWLASSSSTDMSTSRDFEP